MLSPDINFVISQKLVVMEAKINSAGSILNDGKQSLAKRYRALFLLKNIGNDDSVDYICQCFEDPSALLKHELAYCLGQMQNSRAVPTLISVLEDKSQEVMVRHEAGEALGAIGNEDALPVLRKYMTDPAPEVSETCTIAINRISWLNKNVDEILHENPYSSVDPAPPGLKKETDINALKDTLVNERLSLFDRYRAMFSLRNIGTEDSATAVAEGLFCKDSALFRHEIAYVLGQMQLSNVVPQLQLALQNSDENSMVRHECAEALGSIADENCLQILKNHLNDPDDVVRESCVVALDMYNYENSPDFQYATA